MNTLTFWKSCSTLVRCSTKESSAPAFSFDPLVSFVVASSSTTDPLRTRSDSIYLTSIAWCPVWMEAIPEGLKARIYGNVAHLRTKKVIGSTPYDLVSTKTAYSGVDAIE